MGNEMMTELDTDQSGTIDFEEFSIGCLKLIRRRSHEEQRDLEGGQNLGATAAINAAHDAFASSDEDDDESEEEEIPEDQQRRIKLRSAYLMGLGTFLVLLFSDPMVDVLSEFGARTHIPAFYISFVLAPLASNASELIAAYNYALKK